jgi:hypothetical protein
MPDEQDESTRFQLTWPKWLSDRVRRAAATTATPVGAWLRQAALEKLERETTQPKEIRSA